MRISFAEIKESSNGWIDLKDITQKVERLVRQAGASQGVTLVYARDEKAAVITLEADMALILDTADMIDGLLKETRPESKGKIAASLLGTELAVPVVEGHLDLGTWQQIMLVDLGEPGEKRVAVQVVSE